VSPCVVPVIRWRAEECGRPDNPGLEESLTVRLALAATCVTLKPHCAPGSAQNPAFLAAIHLRDVRKTVSMQELAGGGLVQSIPAKTLPAGSADEDRRLAAEDRRRAAHYLSAAYRDDMTGALNRRPGREQMQALLDRARRDASALAVLFIDVDGLKLVNDSRGHDQGDALLAAVGTALRLSLRSYDLVVRYGGDEFVCALPGATAEVTQESLARVRSTLDRLVPGATVSAGCAGLAPTDTIDAVIRRADADLYHARRLGRPSARLSAVSTRPAAEHPCGVSCGVCGGGVPLGEFVLQATERMTRAADCPDCGATTLIQLAHAAIPLPLGEAVKRSDATAPRLAPRS